MPTTSALPATTDRWLRRYLPVASPRLRLLCLPYAGGAPSAFRQWPRLLPGDVELFAACYPGRQDRIEEPCLERMDQLADAVTEAVLPLFGDGVPLVVFGHSMGASLAFEVVLRLERLHRTAPALLLVSGQQPPALFRASQAYAAGDEGVLAEVARLGGDTTSLADPELGELLLPAVRADFAVVGTYRPDPAARVAVPIHALIGDRDAMVTVEEARAWSAATTDGSGSECRVFAGDHFYLTADPAAVVAEVAELTRHVGR